MSLPAPGPPDRGWRKVWADEFEGNELDKSRWSIGQEWPQGKCAYPNAESIDGKPLVEVGDGKLTLFVQRAAAQGKAYSGGLIKTRQHGSSTDKPMVAFRYGYMEARIRYNLPGKGRHANFYTYGYDRERGKESIGYHVWPPEIDIAEVTSYGVNKDRYDRYLVDYHYALNDEGKRVDDKKEIEADWHGNWHVYGAFWRPDGKVDFYFDDEKVYTTEASNKDTAWDVAQYILLRVGTGKSGWGGEPDENVDETNWPGTMEVDWVRIWRPGRK